MPGWPERPEREDHPRSSCRPLNLVRKWESSLGQWTGKSKFGFLKALPTSVWVVEIGGGRAVRKPLQKFR